MLFTLAFMTVWLSGWSLGVGVISGMLTTTPFMIIFLLTHGGAELGVGWMVTNKFIKAANQSMKAPSDVQADLDSVTTRWGPSWKSPLLLVWCALLGLVVMGLLLSGTWAPVIAGATTVNVIVAILLTALWGVLGVRWGAALNEIRKTNQTWSIDATFDRLTIEQRGWLQATRHQLSMEQLTVLEEAHHLRLMDDEHDVTIPCPPGMERNALVEQLALAARRAQADPFDQPEVPQALAEMMTQKT
ncbi:MAG: hypothetical protein AAFV53_28045 [Myxococcota bacterium]